MFFIQKMLIKSKIKIYSTYKLLCFTENALSNIKIYTDHQKTSNVKYSISGMFETVRGLF